MALFKNQETGETKELQFECSLYQDETGELWKMVYITNVLDVDDVVTAPCQPSSLASQVGGSHYKDFAIQPMEFIQKNGLLFYEGSIIKYVCRWRNKNGVEDLKKARHYIDMLIEMEETK